jgi:hypothetical protein
MMGMTSSQAPHSIIGGVTETTSDDDILLSVFFPAATKAQPSATASPRGRAFVVIAVEEDSDGRCLEGGCLVHFRIFLSRIAASGSTGSFFFLFFVVVFVKVEGASRHCLLEATARVGSFDD